MTNILRVASYTVLLIILTLSLSTHAEPATSSPIDVGVVNKERILYWLNKRQQLDKQQLNHQSKQQMLNNYIGVGTSVTPIRNFDKQERTQQRLLAKKMQHSTSLSPDDIQMQVKVLAILIDFPDLPYDDNGLMAEDSDMFYSDYNVEHYQTMLFSQNGYQGPEQQTLDSAYQFYQQASGLSFSFTGEVFGWVTANNPAASYGERQGDIRDIDAPSLVKEAVEKVVAQYNIDLADYDLTDLDDRDGDGITNEPDGIIDHVMLFHSSVGEEAGGGLLSTDAIWSHRFYVYNNENQPSAVAGSNTKLFGYTINPIDAGIGVVVHEFGHDLGLPDEYDLVSSTIGEPVAQWSVMSSGSWAGSPRGSEPVMFSPNALEYLQSRYQGNWLNQQQFNMAELANTERLITLNHAAATDKALNQVKITLPDSLEKFKTPVAGKFQYYSGSGDNYQASFEKTIILPSSAQQTQLTLSAYYSIESNYDYVQVLINDTPVASNYTQSNNPFYLALGPYISGDSFLQSDAQQPNGYLTHEFDLSAYTGQAVTLKINYVTDENTHYYGFVADELTVTQGNSVIWKDGAEVKEQVLLKGFTRVTDHILAKPQHYYLQLRSHLGIDSGLQDEQYSAGLLLWLANENFSDNNTSTHPGEGFSLVIDADQNAIARGNTSEPADTNIQVRDAAFSLYDQSQGLGDKNLAAIDSFSDSNDYSFAQQSESGVELSELGFGFDIVSQAIDSSEVELALSYEPIRGISFKVDNRTVDFSFDGLNLSAADTFTWQFGDGKTSSEFKPNHTYTEYGIYNVLLTQSKENGQVQELTAEVAITEPLTISDINTTEFQGDAVFTIEQNGGTAPFLYQWDFGDGDLREGDRQQSHSYDFSGTYEVKITVIDSRGESASTATDIIVTVPLTLDTKFSANGLNVNFTSFVEGGSGNYSYSWDFGDGEVSDAANPVNIYSLAGTYTVRLVATDLDTITDAEPVSKMTEMTVVVQQNTSSSGSSGGSLSALLLLLFAALVWVKLARKEGDAASLSFYGKKASSL